MKKDCTSHSHIKTCPNCGSRVYSLGCVYCDEDAYIAEQEHLTDIQYPETPADRIMKEPSR